MNPLVPLSRLNGIGSREESGGPDLCLRAAEVELDQAGIFYPRLNFFLSSLSIFSVAYWMISLGA